MRLFIFNIGLFCACSAIWAEECPKLDPETVARLVRELDAADFPARRRATQQLAEAGAEVVESLSTAVAGGSLERRYRALDILGKIYGRGEPDSFDAIEEVLNQVSQSPNASLATTAQTALDVNYETRQRLAVAEIQRLGGSVLHSPSREGGIPGDADPPPDAPREIITSVVISQDWSGGDEGLRHLKRLTRLTSLYRVKEAKVSDEAIDDLRQAIPGLVVAERGKAYLGIVGSQQLVGEGDRCRITSVTPGAAAAKAGIQPDDVITHFGDQAVTDFNRLIDLIKTKFPGEKVPVTLERSGQVVNVTVELLPWPKGK